MNDLISRQDAIKEAYTIIIDGESFDVVQVETLEGLPSAQSDLNEWCYDCKEYDQERCCCHRWTKVIRETIEDFKQAQQERKAGEWIDYSDEGYVECPFCHSATNCEGDKDELHYCFSCGAELR